jgi:hypothetical protein
LLLFFQKQNEKPVTMMHIHPCDLIYFLGED